MANKPAFSFPGVPHRGSVNPCHRKRSVYRRWYMSWSCSGVAPMYQLRPMMACTRVAHGFPQAASRRPLVSAGGLSTMHTRPRRRAHARTAAAVLANGDAGPGLPSARSATALQRVLVLRLTVLPAAAGLGFRAGALPVLARSLEAAAAADAARAAEHGTGGSAPAMCSLTHRSASSIMGSDMS